MFAKLRSLWLKRRRPSPIDADLEPDHLKWLSDIGQYDVDPEVPILMPFGIAVTPNQVDPQVWLPMDTAPYDNAVFIRLEPNHAPAYQVRARYNGAQWMSLDGIDDFWDPDVPTGWKPITGATYGAV